MDKNQPKAEHQEYGLKYTLQNLNRKRDDNITIPIHRNWKKMSILIDVVGSGRIWTDIKTNLIFSTELLLNYALTNQNHNIYRLKINTKMLILISLVLLICIITYLLTLALKPSPRKRMMWEEKKKLFNSIVSQANLSQASNLDIWEQKSPLLKENKKYDLEKKFIEQWILDIQKDQHRYSVPQISMDPPSIIKKKRIHRKNRLQKGNQQNSYEQRQLNSGLNNSFQVRQQRQKNKKPELLMKLSTLETQQFRQAFQSGCRQSGCQQSDCQQSRCQQSEFQQDQCDESNLQVIASQLSQYIEKEGEKIFKKTISEYEQQQNKTNINQKQSQQVAIGKSKFNKNRFPLI